MCILCQHKTNINLSFCTTVKQTLHIIKANNDDKNRLLLSYNPNNVQQAQENVQLNT